MSREITELVKAIRRTRGLTQEQLAREVGVTFSTVNAWENGRHRPIPALLAVLRRLIGSGETPKAPARQNRGSARPTRRGQR